MNYYVNACGGIGLHNIISLHAGNEKILLFE